MNLSRVVVIVAVTAAIVYAGLNFLLPRGAKAGEAQAAESGFGSEVAAAAAAVATSSDAAADTSDSAAAEPESAPTDDSAPAGETMEAGTEVAAVTDSAETSDAPALTEEEARAIAANVAAEAAGADSFAGAAGDSAASGLTDAQRAAIAANIASEGSAATTDTSAVDEAAAVEDAAPAVEETVAEAAPVEEAPAPVEEVAVAEPEPQPAPAPRQPAAPRKPAPKPSNAVNSGADVITAWWKGSSGGGLNLVYVGEARQEKAVVLIFDAEVDAAAAASSIKLLDAKGGAPSGEWSNGNNGRVLAFKGLPSGRYTVIVGAGLTASNGASFGTDRVGPVYVR